MLPKMSGYVKIFKDKNGMKTNKIDVFCKDDETLSKKYKTIWTKI